MRENAGSITRLQKTKRGFLIDHLRGYVEATRWRYEVCFYCRMLSTDNQILNIHVISLSKESTVDFSPGSVKSVVCKSKSLSNLSSLGGFCGYVFNNCHISRQFSLTPSPFSLKI
jgi:hypothetical protein